MPKTAALAVSYGHNTFESLSHMPKAIVSLFPQFLPCQSLLFFPRIHRSRSRSLDHTNHKNKNKNKKKIHHKHMPPSIHKHPLLLRFPFPSPSLSLSLFQPTMSNLTFPCLDPSSPAPPPSPMQPICTSLFSTLSSNCTSSSRSKKKEEPTTNQMKRREMTEDGLEEFYQTDGAVGRMIYEFPGNPYSQGVPAWRLWQDGCGKKGVTMMTKKRESVGWIETYRPRALEEFICHREIALGLRQQVAQGVDSHFIFEGRPGVGKKTMVGAFLREAFGPDTLKTRVELKEFELKGEDKPNIDVHVTLSPQHAEIDLSEIKGNEKHVIPALVEETDTMATKAIVLYQADQLCTDTQDYIRWIMEKHKNCHKFLFCCTDLSNLQSIRSICAIIQLLPPSNDEIFSVLEHIAEKEGIEMPQDVALTIAKDSTYNLPRAIRLFEHSSLAQHNSRQTISV